MLINTDFILPTQLTGYVRQALANQPQNRFQLAQWLPNRNVDDLEYRFTKGAGGLINAATYRAYDAESPIGARQGIVRVTGELPPISRKVRLGEYDRLRQRKDPTVGVTNGLLTDAEKMTLEVAARIELARGDALVNGGVTITENGLVASVTFGRNGAHSVTAGTLWSSTSTADPISDLLAWQTVYAATNGVNPAALVISTPVLTYLLKNANIRAQFPTVNGTAPTIVTRTALSNTIEAFGLPPITVIDEQVLLNGSAQRVIASNVVLMLPEPTSTDDFAGTQLGATFWGTTAESLDSSYGLAEADQPGIVAGAYSETDPVSLWTKAAAIALPVLANPDLSFKAVVA